ncbi:MAG: methyltransferase domain-containing protein [Deltaproteobacteria bacterium]|nr:methyltransferase domain-containing protein [Deltaproteobacteria bacterium]
MFFTIADAMKVSVPLGELAGRGVLGAARPLRVIDLGAGCGAMSLGLVASTDVPLAITAIDRDARALEIAANSVRDLASRRGRSVTIATRTDDATSARLADADLVVMGTLLNELTESARLATVERALAALAPDGALIIIEPALRDTSRDLHTLRDAVLTRGSAHVFAPCTRRGAPCPALANPTDWCHEDRAVTLPPRTAELARLTHLRDNGLKFSYLVLRKGEQPLATEPGAWRIVGEPWSQKGKVEVLGCSDAGRMPLRLLRRNRVDANRELERASRGDVMIVDAPAGDERIEIEATTVLTRRDPSKR